MRNQSDTNGNRAPDPRPARTRAAILGAIERLELGGDELNVSNIVAEAGLSRSSFYSQFKDLGDVAVQLIGELYADAEDSAKDEPAVAEVSAREKILADTQKLLQEVESHQSLYFAVLSSHASVNQHLEVCKIIADGLVRTLEKAAPEGIDPLLTARYIAGGSLSSVICWFESAERLPRESVEKQLSSLLPGWIAQES